MYILKHGVKGPRKFVCKQCKCEFVADVTEYWMMEKFGVTYYKCDCPECTYTSETSEPLEEDDDRSGLVLA